MFRNRQLIIKAQVKIISWSLTCWTIDVIKTLFPIGKGLTSIWNFLLLTAFLVSPSLTKCSEYLKLNAFNGILLLNLLIHIINQNWHQHYFCLRFLTNSLPTTFNIFSFVTLQKLELVQRIANGFYKSVHHIFQGVKSTFKSTFCIALPIQNRGWKIMFFF